MGSYIYWKPFAANIVDCFYDLEETYDEFFTKTEGSNLMPENRYISLYIFAQETDICIHFCSFLSMFTGKQTKPKVKKMMHNIRKYQVALQKYMAMMDLQERNEKLFYKLLIDNVEELLPIVCTATVGEACQKYESIFRHPQGLYISLKEKGKILGVLKNWPERSIQVIVVTDGICCLLHEFMAAVKQNYGEKVLVQFEDFTNHNAFELLEKYGSTHLVFNADIQARNAIGSVVPAIAVGLGALTLTLGTLIPVIGASGFAIAVAAIAIGTVVGSFK